jgi:hypothetical protein
MLIRSATELTIVMMSDREAILTWLWAGRGGVEVSCCVTDRESLRDQNKRTFTCFERVRMTSRWYERLVLIITHPVLEDSHYGSCTPRHTSDETGESEHLMIPKQAALEKSHTQESPKCRGFYSLSLV